MPKHRLTVAPATEAHAAQLAAHLRPEDVAEIMASHGLAPLEGVQFALRVSLAPKTVLDGERVVAMFGVAPVDTAAGIASVWLLASRLVNRLPVAFMRTMAVELVLLRAAWSLLFNMVLATNARALRWVRALGFEVSEPVPFGVAGLPFHPVCLRRV